MPINVQFRFLSAVQQPDGTVVVRLDGDDPDYPLGQWVVCTVHPSNSEYELVIRNKAGSDWRLLDRELVLAQLVRPGS